MNRIRRSMALATLGTLFWMMGPVASAGESGGAPPASNTSAQPLVVIVPALGTLPFLATAVQSSGPVLRELGVPLSLFTRTIAQPQGFEQDVFSVLDVALRKRGFGLEDTVQIRITGALFSQATRADDEASIRTLQQATSGLRGAATRRVFALVAAPYSDTHGIDTPGANGFLGAGVFRGLDTSLASAEARAAFRAQVFANVRLLLVDLKAGQPLAEQRLADSVPLADGAAEEAQIAKVVLRVLSTATEDLLNAAMPPRWPRPIGGIPRVRPADEANPIRQVEAAFPPAAVRAGISSGRVSARLSVDAAGKVTDVRVLSSAPIGVFEEAAVAALRQWQFAPAEEPFETDVELRFRRQ